MHIVFVHLIKNSNFKHQDKIYLFTQLFLPLLQKSNHIVNINSIFLLLHHKRKVQQRAQLEEMEMLHVHSVHNK